MPLLSSHIALDEFRSLGVDFIIPDHVPVLGNAEAGTVPPKDSAASGSAYPRSRIRRSGMLSPYTYCVFLTFPGSHTYRYVCAHVLGTCARYSALASRACLVRTLADSNGLSRFGGGRGSKSLEPHRRGPVGQSNIRAGGIRGGGYPDTRVYRSIE